MVTGVSLGPRQSVWLGATQAKSIGKTTAQNAVVVFAWVWKGVRWGVRLGLGRPNQ